MNDYYRYFLVGAVPVRMTYVGSRRDPINRPVMAEICKGRDTGLVVDNTYMSDVEDGEDVSEIDCARFDAAIEAIRAGRPPPQRD